MCLDNSKIKIINQQINLLIFVIFQIIFIKNRSGTATAFPLLLSDLITTFEQLFNYFYMTFIQLSYDSNIPLSLAWYFSDIFSVMILADFPNSLIHAKNCGVISVSNAMPKFPLSLSNAK